MLCNPPLKRRWYACLQRCASTVAGFDPFGSKNDEERPVDIDAVREHNRIRSYTKTIGDPQKGLADDTRVHPFGDLRVNFARVYTSNLCIWWEYDFTGGQILDNGVNALLSNATKERICAQHQEDPEKWSVEELAAVYGIRQQRVLAILALKERRDEEFSNAKERDHYTDIQPPELPLESSAAKSDADGAPDEAQEQEDEDGGPPNKREPKQIADKDWLDLCDWAERHVFGAVADQGSGERHFVSVPTYPKFEEIPLSEAPKYATTEWDISRINRLYTAKEDRFQIREFKERLEMNTGKIGKSLDFQTDRTRMHRSPPKHDSPIVITSLDEDMARPYVAEPDGTQRKLKPDEFLLWKRQNREAFTKLVRKRIGEKEKRDHVQSSTDN